MKETQNVVGPGAIGDAALSHHLEQIAHQLIAGALNAFDHPEDHPQIVQHGRIFDDLWREYQSIQDELDVVVGLRGGRGRRG